MASSKTNPISSYEEEMINRVHSRFPNNEPTKFFFFFSNASPFSNFYPSLFEENGVQFKFNEQYMMFHKASSFQSSIVVDDETFAFL